MNAFLKKYIDMGLLLKLWKSLV